MEWSTACPDWERRIKARESLIPFPPLFPEQASAALRIFRQLVAVDVAGSPTFGDISRPWLTDLVAAIFGSYDPEIGRRLITEFFWAISKKNGKSTDAAGIMLTALILNWRQSGEFIILAPTVEVANNSFYPARDAVRADDELRDLMHVQEHYRTITHRTTNATLKVVAADSEAVGGKKAIGVFIDELWLFGKRANADNMIREACGGQASRPEGFTIYATTQSDEAPAGVYKKKLDYARGVRDGRIKDNRFLPIIYEFPQAMIDAEEHLNPANFYVTNPNIGASVDEEFLAREFAKAQEEGADSLANFLAKHLNVEVGLALRSTSWAGADFWQQQATSGLTLEAILKRSEVLTIGVDGGGLDDMLAVCVIGREIKTGKWLHWARAWIHPIVLKRRKAEAPRLQDFAKAGDLVIVDKIGDDVHQLVDVIEQCEHSGLLEAVGLDPAGIGAVLDEIEGRGIRKDCVIGISQGWRLVGAIKTAERRLAEGGLIHGGSGLMAWCVGNAKVEPRGNAILITKQASGSAKIDPLMATFDAVELMARNPAARSKRYQVLWI